MKKILVILLVLCGSAAVLVSVAGWCMVAPGEVVVVRRLGRLLAPPWGPGLHCRIPFSIDRLDRVRAGAVRQLTTGLSGTAGSAPEPASGEFMTGDLNLLLIQATIHYRVASPTDYVLRSAEVEALLAESAESSVSRALAFRGVDAVLRSDRQAISGDVEHDLQAAADRYGLGVTILGVSFTEARPPSEVAADFAAAQRAQSQRESRVSEAHSYAETSTTKARSLASSKLEAARADAARTLLAARARGQRFTALLAEAERSRFLTIRRIYIESLRMLLNRVKKKLILPPGGDVDLTVFGVNEERVTGSPESISPGQSRPESLRGTK
jgi:membrane protease subunit HflK